MQLTELDAYDENAAEPSLAQQVMAYIEAHCTEKLSCAKIAQAFSYHPNSLNRIMNQELGCSIREAITRAKINEAIRLLTHTDMNIAEIAYRLNYYDHAHFAKTFRDITASSPSDYRELHRQSQIQTTE